MLPFLLPHVTLLLDGLLVSCTFAQVHLPTPSWLPKGQAEWDEGCDTRHPPPPGEYLCFESPSNVVQSGLKGNFKGYHNDTGTGFAMIHDKNGPECDSLITGDFGKEVTVEWYSDGGGRATMLVKTKPQELGRKSQSFQTPDDRAIIQL